MKLHNTLNIAVSRVINTASEILVIIIISFVVILRHDSQSVHHVRRHFSLVLQLNLISTIGISDH